MTNDPSYKGNGWSQYQIYVLKQLEDHNTLLQKLIEKNSDFFIDQHLMQKEIQTTALSIEKITKVLVELEAKVNTQKDSVGDIKKEKEIEKAVKTSSKAIWGTVGALAMGVFAVVYELIKHAIAFFMK